MTDFAEGPTARWELWHQDLFDRDSPRRVDLAGHGLIAGLVELWARHLFETVQASGDRGFSKFNLWLPQAGLSIEVIGDWQGQVRLRHWLYGTRQLIDTGYAEAGDQALLMGVAAAHHSLLLKGETSAELLGWAAGVRSRAEFVRRVSQVG